MITIKQLVCILILGVTVRETQASRLRRCYVCRSRSELGDCKDPFGFNSTTVDDVKGVEASPCASGWCGKIIDGGSEDFDAATERICVPRPPTDGEERCAETIVENYRKPVYMCFCHGDLCNAAVSSHQVKSIVLVIFAVLLAFINQRFIA